MFNTCRSEKKSSSVMPKLLCHAGKKQTRLFSSRKVDMLDIHKTMYCGQENPCQDLNVKDALTFAIAVHLVHLSV